MRSNILEQRRDPSLRVYAVWVDRLGATKEDIDESVLADERVMHFWDGEAHVGSALAGAVDYPGPELWDAYVLFRPEARWEAGRAPEGLAGSGWTVIGESERLAAEVDALLGGP